VAQTVNNLLAMQETQVQSLGGEERNRERERKGEMERSVGGREKREGER